jgi:uncharacterized protein YndB with AHSA1/START domain
MPVGTPMYVFVTEWEFDASVEAVWKEIHDVDAWPTWWRGVVAVDVLEPGDRAGIGSYRRMTWKSLLPYSLVFAMRTTRIEPPHAIEGNADGELRGSGKWTLTPAGARTRVRYDWQVEATRPWMRALGPIARPVFAWNHDVIMRWGFEGLKARLAAQSAD